MRSTFRRRIETLGARHRADEAPRLIRFIQVFRPELPEPDQTLWIEAAEACVLEEYPNERGRPVVFFSHVESPGLVTVDAGRAKHWVAVEHAGDSTTARITRSEGRGW